MLADLSGMLAVITGAGQIGGMGAGIASELACHGAGVVLTDVDVEHSNEVSEGLGDGFLGAVALDVTSPASVREAFGAISQQFGTPDLLVNNAGVGAGDDEDGWHRTFAVNLHGVVRCCEAALLSMRPRGRGKIVNIASMSGHAARGSAGSYGTSKAAVLRYTTGLAIDEAPNGINVNAVCPGAVWTEMQRRAFSTPGLVDPELTGMEPYEAFCAYYAPLTPLGRVQSAEDVGKAVAFLLSDDASNITGQCLHVDGGAIRS